jgi:myosin heavy subunit
LNSLGKTEATKLCLQYITECSSTLHDDISQQILEANPVLEAFGNSKTQRNNNSSRFGKWLKIFFNSHTQPGETAQIKGAEIDNYTLEKSRVIQQAENETNYHIYYLLLAGASSTQRTALRLSSSTHFRILNPHLDSSIVATHQQDWLDVCAALDKLNFSSEEIEGIFQMVATILHIGNIEFVQDGDSKCKIADNSSSIEFISSLLSVSPSLLSSALLSRTYSCLVSILQPSILSYNVVIVVMPYVNIYMIVYSHI